MASDSTGVDQIVLNYYAKCLQIILESRIPSFTSSPQYGVDSSIRKVMTSLPSNRSDSEDCWFNMPLSEFGPRLENLETCCTWRPKRMVIDILLSQSLDGPIERFSIADTRLGERYTYGQSKLPSRGQVDIYRESRSPTRPAGRIVDSSVCSTERNSILERWVVQFEKSTLKETGTMHSLDSSAVYKKAVILLRSLYCTARLLPAHSLFRNACSSCVCSFTLSHRVSVSSSPLSDSCKNMKDMISHNFIPVESRNGHMCLSVLYQCKIPVAALQALPISANIIPDYAGSSSNDPYQTTSGNWHFQHPAERRDMHLLSVPGSSKSSPGSSHNCSGLNDASFLCKTSVVRKVKDNINDLLFTLLPSFISTKSIGHANAEDEEPPHSYAVDVRMGLVNAEPYSVRVGSLSNGKSRNGEIGELIRMLNSAAPLKCALQHPSGTRLGKFPETSWSNSYEDFFLYTSDRDLRCDAGSINPAVGKMQDWPKKTLALSLEELQVYREIRDSLLNQDKQ